MEYRFLGRTGLKVSEMCFGTQTFGWGADEPTAHRMASAFMEAGGNFFDSSSVNCDNPLLSAQQSATLGCTPAMIAAGDSVGLYIARQLVELHGGRVWVDSRGDESGGVFSFTLPQETLAQRQASQRIPEAALPRPETLPDLQEELQRLQERLLVMAGLVEQAVRMGHARDARGIPASLSRRAQVAGHMIGVLFLRSWERAERVGQAMTARGFTGTLPVIGSADRSPSDRRPGTGPHHPAGLGCATGVGGSCHLCPAYRGPPWRPGVHGSRLPTRRPRGDGPSGHYRRAWGEPQRRRLLPRVPAARGR